VPALVHQDVNACALQLLNHKRIVEPEVVVAQDAERAHGGANQGQGPQQLVDVARVEGNVVPTQEKQVRPKPGNDRRQ
jgi:hypothetical protein